jgi:hypothetical protein
MKLGDLLFMALHTKRPTHDQEFMMRRWVYRRGCDHKLSGFTQFEACPFCRGLKGIAG